MTSTRKRSLKSGTFDSVFADRDDRKKRFKKIQHRLNYNRLLDDLELELTSWRGEEWCSCPLPFGNHPKGDRDASFSINLDNPEKTGLYNCFVCGGGNIIHLVALLNDLEYEDAERFVSHYITGREETFLDDIKHVLDIKDKIRDNKEVMVEHPPFTEWFTHPWMFEQGFTMEAVKHFQLTYEREQNGVLFPHWHRGKLVGWQLRNMDEDSKQRWKLSPHFPKRSTLFHYDCNCVRQADEVVVVESPKSVVKLWSLGMKNAVATFGAGVNYEQLQTLWSFDKVFLWFDNDLAGAKATETATKYLRGMVDLYVVPPVEQEKGDPADLDSEEELWRCFSKNWRQL